MTATYTEMADQTIKFIVQLEARRSSIARQLTDVRMSMSQALAEMANEIGVIAGHKSIPAHACRCALAAHRTGELK